MPELDHAKTSVRSCLLPVEAEISNGWYREIVSQSVAGNHDDERIQLVTEGACFVSRRSEYGQINIHFVSPRDTIYYANV